MRRFLATIVSSLLVLASAHAFATVPQTLTQQGRLLNTDGTPVTGPVRMIFNIYDSSSATTPLWTETQSNVMLDNGAFSVQLGSVTAFPSTLWSGPTRYVGVTIGNDPEMMPREEITSVPYALFADTAQNANQLGGVAASSYAVQSMLTGGTVTSVATGDGLQGGPITTTGSISVNSTVSRTGHTHSLVCAVQNATAQAANYSFATCPSGTVVVGGGCARTTAGASYENRNSPAVDPNFPNSWSCTTQDGSGITSYAICCHTTIQ